MAIKQTSSKRYAALLRLYLGLLGIIATCAATVCAAEGMRLGAALAAAAAGTLIFLLLLSLASGGRLSRVTYTREGGSLVIHRGIFTRRRVILNRSDIQYAETVSDPLTRRMGLCSVIFFTSGGRVTLRGIHTDDGQRLRYLFGGEAAD